MFKSLGDSAVEVIDHVGASGCVVEVDHSFGDVGNGCDVGRDDEIGVGEAFEGVLNRANDLCDVWTIIVNVDVTVVDRMKLKLIDNVEVHSWGQSGRYRDEGSRVPEMSANSTDGAIFIVESGAPSMKTDMHRAAKSGLRSTPSINPSV